MSETQKGAVPMASVEEDPNAAVACNSPPCFMHELDPSYLGYLGREEVSELLRALLAAEWDGAVPDEPGLRAALRRHLETPGGGRPDGSHEAAATPGEPLDREPGRLARTVREALPRIHDDALRRDLGKVLEALRHGVPHRDGPQDGSRPA